MNKPFMIPQPGDGELGTLTARTPDLPSGMIETGQACSLEHLTSTSQNLATGQQRLLGPCQYGLHL
jgi:hypothetical protein